MQDVGPRWEKVWNKGKKWREIDIAVSWGYTDAKNTDREWRNMMDCISVGNMRESDRLTIEKYVPSRTLMYRAAMGVYLAHDWQGRTAIVVGSGNNGGDGYALACILKKKGYECRLIALSDKRSEDGNYYAVRAEELGVEERPYLPGCLAGSDVIVDCLLGTGFQGSVRPGYEEAIREINKSDAFVISVDINSGMNGDTGRALTAVRSDLTVTIGFVKNGLVAPGADRWIGRLVCADIGIVLNREENKICSEEEWNGERADDERCFLRPAYLDMKVIDTSKYEEEDL